MKKISLLFLYFFVWSQIHASIIKKQPLTEYTADNNITYRAGDVLRTYKGTHSDGSFRFIYSGIGTFFDEDDNADSGLKTMTIKEITKVNPAFKNHPEIVFIVKGDDDMTYSVRIDKALEAEEIITKRPEVLHATGTRPRPRPRPNQRSSRLDLGEELLKLKSLQDQGILKYWEYADQKEKLLKTGVGTVSVADELLKLKALRDNGVLRPLEYLEQKEKLLKTP